jgi:hypothetical protein
MIFSLSHFIKSSFVKGLHMAQQANFADKGFVTAHPQEVSETNRHL